MRPAYKLTCFLLLLLVVAMVGSMLLVDSNGPRRSRARPNYDTTKVYAWAMARKFVKAQLTSPSTADFGSVFGEAQVPGEIVTALGNRTYCVRAWVDSQNSFGATVRTRFTCEVRDNGGGSWSCTSLTFDP